MVSIFNTIENVNLINNQNVLLLDEGDIYITSSGKTINYKVRTSFIEIIDGYKYDKEERIEILYYLDSKYQFDRSIYNMESEWFLHNICYGFNIKIDNAKDVAIDYDRDKRRSVYFFTGLLQAFGL